MKKTLFLVAALCAAVAQAAVTIEYDQNGDITDGASYTLKDEGNDTEVTFALKNGQNVTLTKALPSSGFSSSTLTVSGNGTLNARINDYQGKDGEEPNNFTGNVNVLNGATLNILGGKIQPNASIGGGENVVITVSKGSTLNLKDGSGIGIPGGNAAASGNVASMAIRNSVAPAYNKGVSTLSNVVVNNDSIVAENTSGGALGKVVANEVSIADFNAQAPAKVQNTVVYSDQFGVTGHSEIDNSTIYVTQMLNQLPSSTGRSMKVSNGSKVILDNSVSGKAYANLYNTEVDKTSFINGGNTEGELMNDMQYVQLMAGNELHVASKDAGGVATQYFRDPAGKIVETIDKLQEVEDVYVTDQLSGCALQVGSKLMVTLDDTMLPDPMKYKTFTFTMVLKGLDSTAVLAGRELDEKGFADMTKDSPVQLSIGAYKDAPWYQMDTTIQLAAFNGTEDTWKGNGPATVFKFTVKNLVIPEPTTVTLSLLALAGLAARRRRH